MPFDKKYDKAALKATWEDWAQGKRPDIANMPALAEAMKIPVAYVYKHTGKWGRELRAKLQGQLDTVTKSKPRHKDQSGIVRGTKGRINADSPLARLSYTDEFRKARQLGKDALSVAMQGLIDEATTGTGASRVSAIRELLDRSGLAKDKERKDEASPYEEEDAQVLRDRLIALVGSNTMLTSLLKPALKGEGDGEKNPTTSQHAVVTNPITPSPTGIQVSCVSAGEAGVEAGEVACVEVVPGPLAPGPSVMLA